MKAEQIRCPQLFPEALARSNDSLNVSNVFASTMAKTTRSKAPLNLASSTTNNSAHNFATVATLFLFIRRCVRHSAVDWIKMASPEDACAKATQNHISNTLLVE